MNIITKQDIDDVWSEYGKKRIEDLVREHRHQCKEIESIISSFRESVRLFTSDDLFNHINSKILNHTNIFIDSIQVRSPKDVAHFLFRIGFIVARSDDENGEYEHYSFKQMPSLLTANTNNDFGMRWEIHPCYRQALEIKQLNHAQKIKKGIKSQS